MSPELAQKIKTLLAGKLTGDEQIAADAALKSARKKEEMAMDARPLQGNILLDPYSHPIEFTEGNVK